MEFTPITFIEEVLQLQGPARQKEIGKLCPQFAQWISKLRFGCVVLVVRDDGLVDAGSYVFATQYDVKVADWNFSTDPYKHYLSKIILTSRHRLLEAREQMDSTALIKFCSTIPERYQYSHSELIIDDIHGRHHRQIYGIIEALTRTQWFTSIVYKTTRSFEYLVTTGHDVDHNMTSCPGLESVTLEDISCENLLHFAYRFLRGRVVSVKLANLNIAKIPDKHAKDFFPRLENYLQITPKPCDLHVSLHMASNDFNATTISAFDHYQPVKIRNRIIFTVPAARM